MSRPNWRKGKGPSQQPPEEPTKTLDVALRTPLKPLASGEQFSTSPQESTSCVFFEVSLEFANACADVWPKDEYLKASCEKLAVHNDKYEMKHTEGKKMALAFHAACAEHYPLIVKKDASFFSQNIPVLVEANAASKFASSPAEVRNTIWEYLRSLVQYAGMVDMYSKCPQAMLDTISGVAGGLIAKLQSGEMDAASLNPLQLGQMMMQEMSAADLEGFGEAIMQGGNMESMMSIMQSTMSSMGGSGAAGMSGMPDLSMLSSLFGSK